MYSIWGWLRSYNVDRSVWSLCDTTVLLKEMSRVLLSASESV